MRPPSSRISSLRSASSVPSSTPAANTSDGSRARSTRRASTRRVASSKTTHSSSPRTGIEIHPPVIDNEDDYEVLDAPSGLTHTRETTVEPRLPSASSNYVDDASDAAMGDSSSSEESSSRAVKAPASTKRAQRTIPLRLLQRRRSSQTTSVTSSRNNKRLRTRRQSPRSTSRLIGARSKQDSVGTESSDDVLIQTRQTRQAKPATKRRKRSSSASFVSADLSDNPNRRKSRRQRNVKYDNLTEIKLNETDASEESDSSMENISGATTPGRPPMYAKEVFKAPEDAAPFLNRHNQHCASCSGRDGAQNKGPMVFCQGCTNSYHAACLGPRRHREHLVTRVAEDEFVLQCRFCIGSAVTKNPLAPHYGRCSATKELSPLSVPLRTPDNDTIDSVIPAENLHNPDNVMFRCQGCKRAWKMAKLPPLKQRSASPGSVFHGSKDENDSDVADERSREYSRKWTCIECLESPEAQTIVAWRPIGIGSDETRSIDEVPEADREYLIKWKEMSYLHCTWMPGNWVFGSLPHKMRQSFTKKGPTPKFTTEDAFPPGYLHVDIILKVRFTHKVRAQDQSYEADLARINDVKEIYTKFQGLPYEDCVWTAPPSPEESEKWAAFEKAYKTWALGNWIQPPERKSLTRYLKEIRKLDFKKQFLKEEQPSFMVGGKLMDYQLDGLNWIYYQWFIKRNAILADEMGLGKTIQVIAFIATLIQDHQCFPFLIVAPNSTCANWRREFNTWTPSIRAVMYYGTSKSRELVQDYELFMKSDNQLNCHVVITSYEAAVDPTTKRVFNKTPWAGLIVDEGQRLKNDKNLLYSALQGMDFPFRLLLTGTPLQNNVRELFNVLSFCNPTIDSEEMAERYEVITKENIGELHEMIRPYFLRRTKAQALKFLPPMAQMIIPLSMTVLQKKLSKSILAKNPELIRSIFDSSKTVAAGERHNLNNILMQLRKCLCHPFIYNRDIEDRSVNPEEAHRNLIDASAKLKLLELLLPKLKERGHRVLLFSQFLDNLSIIEDFLDAMGMKYCRLDGSKSALERQKDMDDFNAEDSPYFAFLLSTRAGGIGINLATADTVIILDPDFNPHQDMQALSRAHRIGQQKKVLVFQLMTRASAEEKIMQIGKKKMALDHVLIQRMDADDEEDVDVETILRHGADDIFGDNTENDIHYDQKAIEQLLDRSHIESIDNSDETENPESQFSFAKVWMNNTGQFEDALGDADADTTIGAGAWEKILQEREMAAAEAAKLHAEALGRGKRRRQAVNYKMAGYSPKRTSRKQSPNSPDADFKDDGQSSSTTFSDSDPEAEAGAAARSALPTVTNEDPFAPQAPATMPNAGPQVSSQAVSQPAFQMSFPAPSHPRPQPMQGEFPITTPHVHPSPNQQQRFPPNGHQATPVYHQLSEPLRVSQSPQLQQISPGMSVPATNQRHQNTQIIPTSGPTRATPHSFPQNSQQISTSSSPQITTQFPRISQQNPAHVPPHFYSHVPSPFGNQQMYPMHPQGSPQYFMPGPPVQRQSTQNTPLHAFPPPQSSYLLQQLQGISQTNTPYDGLTPSTRSPHPLPPSLPSSGNFPRQSLTTTSMARPSDNSNNTLTLPIAPQSGFRTSPSSPMPTSFSQQLQDISAAISVHSSSPAPPAVSAITPAPQQARSSTMPPSVPTSHSAPSQTVAPTVPSSMAPVSSRAQTQATASIAPPSNVPGSAPRQSRPSTMPPVGVFSTSFAPPQTVAPSIPSSVAPVSSPAPTIATAPTVPAPTAPGPSTGPPRSSSLAAPSPAVCAPPAPRQTTASSGPPSTAPRPSPVPLQAVSSATASPVVRASPVPSQATASNAPLPGAFYSGSMATTATSSALPRSGVFTSSPAPSRTVTPNIPQSVAFASGPAPTTATSSTVPAPTAPGPSPVQPQAVSSATASPVVRASSAPRQAAASSTPPGFFSSGPTPTTATSSTMPPSTIMASSSAQPQTVTPSIPTSVASGPSPPPPQVTPSTMPPQTAPEPSPVQPQAGSSATTSPAASAPTMPRQPAAVSTPPSVAHNPNTMPPQEASSTTASPAVRASPAPRQATGGSTSSTAAPGPGPVQPHAVSSATASSIVSAPSVPPQPAAVSTPTSVAHKPNPVPSQAESSATASPAVRASPVPPQATATSTPPPGASVSGPAAPSAASSTVPPLGTSASNSAALPVVASTMPPPTVPPPTTTGRTSSPLVQPFPEAAAPTSMFSKFRAVNNQSPVPGQATTSSASSPSISSPSTTGNGPAASVSVTPSSAPASSAPPKPHTGNSISTSTQPSPSLPPTTTAPPKTGNDAPSAAPMQPARPQQAKRAPSLPIQPTTENNTFTPIQGPPEQPTLVAPGPAETAPTTGPPDSTMSTEAHSSFLTAAAAAVTAARNRNRARSQSGRGNSA